MPTIVFDGVKLAYDERGSGSPGLVFIHGWASNRSFFAPQVEHFATRLAQHSPHIRYASADALDVPV